MERRRVLIVEDDVLVRTVIADVAAGAGYDPVCAPSVEDAIRVALRDTPHAAIVDRDLSGATGCELIRLVHDSPDERVRALPIIGISGRLGSEQEMLEAGACCFLEKPIDEYRLGRAIRWAIDVYWRDDGACATRALKLPPARFKPRRA
jgi:CheY-like chemotaxis protein